MSFLFFLVNSPLFQNCLAYFNQRYAISSLKGWNFWFIEKNVGILPKNHLTKKAKSFFIKTFSYSLDLIEFQSRPLMVGWDHCECPKNCCSDVKPSFLCNRFHKITAQSPLRFLTSRDYIYTSNQGSVLITIAEIVTTS